jgi:ferredoxin-NADP reductase
MADYKADVTAVEQLVPNVVQLTISLESGFRFAPGQYVSVRLANGVARAYCIASAPERPEALQLCVRLGQGKGSQALREVKTGDTLAVDGPYGDFILPEDDQSPVVLIAGDTGIAPIRSIVLHMLATDDPRPITVLYEPDRSNILYAGDFDPLAKSGRIVYESGDIGILVKRHHKELVSSTLMIAGFDPFLDKARQALTKAGAAPDRAIIESFGKL